MCVCELLLLNSYLQLSFLCSAKPQLNLEKKQNFTFVSVFVVMMSMNSDPALFLIHGQYIDGVFVIDNAAPLFPSQPHNHPSTNTVFWDPYTHHHLAPHSVFWDPYTYHHQFIHQPTDDVNQLIARLSAQPFDDTALIDLPAHHTEVSQQQQQQEEEIVMMKTTNHCVNKVDSEEICSICLSDYVNDDTIGTLSCGHEYHANCIQQWLLRGKKNCPICRSSV